MVFDEITILYIQVLSAVLMGVGYIISDKKITAYEEKFKVSLLNVGLRLSSDIETITRSKFYITKFFFISLILFYLPIANLHYRLIPMPNIFEYPNLWQVQLICLTTISLIGFARIIDVSKALLMLWALPSAVKAFFQFLRNCEKGPIATVGFLLLLISFLMRYLNLS